MRKIVLDTDTFSAKWLGVRMGESRGETYGLSGGSKEASWRRRSLELHVEA